MKTYVNRFPQANQNSVCIKSPCTVCYTCIIRIWWIYRVFLLWINRSINKLSKIIAQTMNDVEWMWCNICSSLDQSSNTVEYFSSIFQVHEVYVYKVQTVIVWIFKLPYQSSVDYMWLWIILKIINQLHINVPWKSILYLYPHIMSYDCIHQTMCASTDFVRQEGLLHFSLKFIEIDVL